MYHEAFPHYLAMGMTWEQFWEQDSALVKDYREAKRLRIDEENYVAWLHGLYIYEALCNASPLFRAFSKSGTTARPYPDKPHELERRKRMTEKEENEQKMRDGMAYMQRMTARFNQAFYQKQKAMELAGKQTIAVQKGETKDGGHTNA